MNFKIETDVPIPQSAHGRPPKYPFRELEIGESFFVQNTEDHQVRTIRFLISYYKKKHGLKFKTMRENNGLRVWRVGENENNVSKTKKNSETKILKSVTATIDTAFQNGDVYEVWLIVPGLRYPISKHKFAYTDPAFQKIMLLAASREHRPAERLEDFAGTDVEVFADKTRAVKLVSGEDLR